MSIKKCCLIAIITATVSVLMACGGGGGGGTENQVTDLTLDPLQPIPTYAKERSQSLGLGRINAEAAYDRGWTGEGVTVGYYEIVIDASHPELSGKLVDNPYDEIEPGSYNNVVYTLAQATEHAQRAAGVAAAKRDKIGMHGVAYDSRIVFVSSQNKTFNDLIDQQYIDDPFNVSGREARSVNYLNGRVPIAFNSSPGFVDWSTRTPDETESGFNNKSWIAALRQETTSAATRTIWIFGAGNKSKLYPIGAGYFPVHFPELQPHVIAAVALDSTGAIASYSNRCGAARAFCIAAPGRHYAPAGENGYSTVQGTSFAAPTVAGALAILKQAFPSLGNDELVTRLFATANKTGIYATTATYGQGLVDLDAATQPLGTLMFLMNGPFSGPSSSVLETKVVTTPPFGDAFVNAFRDRRVMLLDDLNTPFFADLSRFVSTSSPAIAPDRLSELQRQIANPELEPENDMSLQFIRLAGETAHVQNDLEFTAGKNDAIAFAKKFEIRRTEKSSLQLTAGSLVEPETTLGSMSTGAFGTQYSASLLSGLKSELTFNTWRLSVSGMLSLTSTNNNTGVIRSTTPLLASSFAMDATRKTANGALRFTLSQPLRIETGQVKLTIPASRTPDKKPKYETFKKDLRPSGRQIDLEMEYVQRIGANAAIGAEIWLTKDSGHSGNAKPSTGIAAALRVKF